MKVIILKQTKLIKTMKILWLLEFFILFAAIFTHIFNIQIYSTLYIVGLAFYVTVGMLSLIVVNNDREHIKNLEINKKDERIKSITVLSKAKAFDIFAVIFPLVLMFSAFLKIVDLNACIIFGILCLLPIVLQIYYFFNFSKKM